MENKKIDFIQLDIENYIKGREKLHGKQHQIDREKELKPVEGVKEPLNAIGQEVVNNKKSLTVISGDWDLKSRIKRFDMLAKNVLNSRQMSDLIEEGDDEDPDDFCFADEDFPIEKPFQDPVKVPGHQEPTEPDPVPEVEPEDQPVE